MTCRSDRPELVRDRDLVDDTHDRRIDGRRATLEGRSRRAALNHDEYFFADAGAHRVNRQDGRAARRPIGRVDLDKKQLGAIEFAMLLRGDDGADDSRQLHRDLSAASAVLRHVPVVDNANDAGVDRRFTGQERKGRFSAPHKKDVLAHARAHCVGRDDGAAGRFPVGRDGLQDEEFVAVKIHVFHRRHDIANDLRKMHVLILVWNSRQVR
jgi:hypothetical protein